LLGRGLAGSDCSLEILMLGLMQSQQLLISSLIDFADKPQIAAVLISPASSETIKST
jgi:hypothetical protein